MKVLLVGSSTPWAIENHYLKYLNENPGVSASLFPIRSLFFDYYYKSLAKKLLFRIGLSNVYSSLNKALVQEAESKKPDVVWVFKGLEVFPSTLRLFKRWKIKLVNYNPDHPFEFFSPGSGNRNVLDNNGLYDLHFTYINSLIEKIGRIFDVPAVHLPFGYELSEESYARIKDGEEYPNACFVGNPDKERAHLVNLLLKANIPVDVYGNNWQKFLKSKPLNLQIFPAVYGDDFWSVIRRYRVQLNAFRLHNIGSHNMRSFEIPAAGGIMLAPSSAEHKEFFENEKEAFFFSDFDEAVSLCKKIIGFSNDEASSIRINARKRSLDSNYSYRERSGDVVSNLEKIM